MSPRARLVLAVCILAVAGPGGTSAAVPGTPVHDLTLKQVIEIAQSRSPDAAIARHRYRSSYWQYKNAQATFLPTLTLDATVPDLSRSISRITVPDGSEIFISRSFATSSAQVSLRKIVGTTGGEVFLQSGLDRIDLLDGGEPPSYLSRPVSLGFRQPLFSFNPYTWQNRIEPLKFDEARRAYFESLENIAVQATGRFFDLLASQDQLESARANYASMDTVYRVAQQRHKQGGVSDDELTRTELAFLNARLDLMQSELDAEDQIQGFRTFLGIRDTGQVKLEMSEDVPDLVVSVPLAQEEARRNRSDAIGFNRRLLEADRDLAEARADRGLSANLFVNYGFSESTNDITKIFRRGQESQQVSVGIQVPLLDWGRWRSRMALAQSNWSVTHVSVEREREELDQDVFSEATQFNVQRERLRIAARIEQLARIHFDTAKRRYVTGDGDLTEVNLALQEKTSARRNLVSALRGYWAAYHQLRRATLFDFARMTPLVADEPAP